MSTAERKADNRPVGIIDKEGRVWPFSQKFTPQMEAAGIEPIYNDRDYIKLLRAQRREDRIEEAKRAREGVAAPLDVAPDDHEAVNLGEAAAAVGVKTK